ncbi:MAG: FAD-dependent oxidoreductase, partial [Alphaproteobacteria bacterium]
ILVATGSWPVIPPIPGREHAITSNQAFHLERLPRRAIVVGGGYIALEFAGIFNGLGAETALVHRGDMVLRGFDDDVRRTVAAETAKKGVRVRLGTTVEALERVGDGVRARTADGDWIEADQVMFATGRAPNTGGLGLAENGVELDPKGAVVVDAYSRSSVGSIYAIGDVTDRLNLTPVAIHEGMCLADTLFNDTPRRPDHRDVPTAVFSQPPIGTVGLTEAEARRLGGRIDVYRSRFRPLKHTLTGRDEETMMKIVVDAQSDQVLGCHMVGADAAEIIQGIAIAVKCRAKKAQFDATIGIHPTAAEEFVTMRQKAPQPLSEAAE